MTLVMIAGPLSGLVVQPIIGALADRSTSKWGRRRPYMLAGCFLAALSLIMLSRAQELAQWMSGKKAEDSVGYAQAIAILAVYLLDFTVNVGMVASRTLTMDVLPTELQSASGAWASRMTGIGGVIGYYSALTRDIVGSGTMPLDKYFPALGNSQVAVLTALAAIFLLWTHLATAFAVSEAVHIPTPQKAHQLMFGSIFSKTKLALLEGFKNIPRDIMSVYIVQFFSAMGWFPAIFFGTVWMGDIYVHQMRQLKGAEAGSDEALRAEAGRAGSNALFYGAVVTLATSIILPYFVEDLRSQSEDSEPRDGVSRSTRSKLKPNLTMLWMIGHGLLGLSLLSSSFVQTIQGATFVYLALGYHGGVGNWVPYAIVAAHKESSQSYIRLNNQEPSGDLDIELEALLEESEPTTNPDENQLAGDTPNRIGWFLGLHNVSIVIPMFVCILMSATIFAVLEPGRSVIGGGSSESAGGKRGSSMDIVL
ncbi:hypothetical protein FRC09_016125, partial [Ceratobasidium sp. 395]